MPTPADLAAHLQAITAELDLLVDLATYHRVRLASFETRLIHVETDVHDFIAQLRLVAREREREVRS
jgi:acyl transferase domain-containing protein